MAQSSTSMQLKAGLFSLRYAAFSLLVLFFLQWNSFPVSQLHRNSAVRPAQDLSADLSRTQGVPFEASVFDDFDGDHKQDAATARLEEDGYHIFVSLSTRSHVTVLNPSVLLPGFRVYACDINHDSFQDVVVTGSAALHPLEIWLGNGKGKFRIADQKLFGNDFDLTEPSKLRNHGFNQDQDFLTESWHPLFDKTSPASGTPRLKHQGFLDCGTPLCVLRDRYFDITPRSPPRSFLL
jgi:hypothetical protein